MSVWESDENCSFLVKSLFDQAFDTARGIQRQFSKNIYLEDDLRSRIFGTFKISCLLASPSNFEHLKNGIIGHF